MPTFRPSEFAASRLPLGSPLTAGLQEVLTPQQQSPNNTLARKQPLKAGKEGTFLFISGDAIFQTE